MCKGGLSFQLEKSRGSHSGWMVVWKRARSWLLMGGRGLRSGVGSLELETWSCKEDEVEIAISEEGERRYVR